MPQSNQYILICKINFHLFVSLKRLQHEKIKTEVFVKKKKKHSLTCHSKHQLIIF